MEDYCTGWWDGWPTWAGGSGDEWRHCCRMHDGVYTETMTFLQKLAADVDLYSCVGGVMGAIMWAGVSTLGLVIVMIMKNQLTKGRDANSVPWRKNQEK